MISLAFNPRQFMSRQIFQSAMLMMLVSVLEEICLLLPQEMGPVSGPMILPKDNSFISRRLHLDLKNDVLSTKIQLCSVIVGLGCTELNILQKIFTLIFSIKIMSIIKQIFNLL